MGILHWWIGVDSTDEKYSDMKIFTTSEIRRIEEQTLKVDEISEIDLMERAASAAAFEVMSRWRPSKRFVVFAGPGNNGGDALAMARLLKEQGYNRIEVFLFNIPSTKLSKGCVKNRERLKEMDGVDFTEIVNEFEPPALGRDDVVIDGLFGSGLREPLKGGFTSLVQYINESQAYIVAIDIPSGLFGEWNTGSDRRNIIRANLTLAFQFKRLSYFFAENAANIGECKVLDIDLNRDAINKAATNYYLVEDYEVKNLLRRRPDHCSKYDFGSLLLVAGRYGMLGAAILAARAAMRAGAGVVSVHCPRCGHDVLQTSVPEALFSADKNEIVTSDITMNRRYNTVALGPGMGTNDMTVDAIDRFLKTRNLPCVLDADALNCIAARPMLFESIPQKSILTPHLAEFERIFGKFDTEEERLKKAIEVAKSHKLIIVMKAHYTMVVDTTGKVYVNTTGNPGMATAGSGDVLTGIISGLLAQGYSPQFSAIMGVYIHGVAGDLAEKVHGSYGMIASDIVDNIGRAIKEIMM